MELVVPRDNGYLTSADTGWPRISQRAYEGVFIAFLPIIITASMARLGIKFHMNRRLEIDDGLLVLALSCSVAAWVFVWLMRDLIYLQMELVLGMTAVTLEDVESMVVYFKWYNVSMVLTWTAVYAVKLSFMFFFRKLISRVRTLEVYWGVIMALLIPTWAFSSFFSFWICPYFSIAYLSKCPVDSMIFREETYIYTTSALDIFTDLLIISLPILLLARVSISLKRKLMLGMALCLSVFMIVICIIRISTCKLPNGVVDSTWLALWQCIETNTAILLVSLTAFRSLYRQGASPSYATPPYCASSKPSFGSFWPASLSRFRLFNGSRSGGGRDMQEQRQQEPKLELDYGVLPERPRRAVPFIRRGATQEEIDSQLLPSLDFASDTMDSTVSSDKDFRGNHPYRWSVRSPEKSEAQFQVIGEERDEHDP